MGMSREDVSSILDQIRRLTPEDRVALADEVDHLTWRDRVQALVARTDAHQTTTRPIADEEIDQVVDQVRSEKPLYERYWTRLRRSAL